MSLWVKNSILCVCNGKHEKYLQKVTEMYEKYLQKVTEMLKICKTFYLM